MKVVTWSEDKAPPTRERGLPNEIHFWRFGNELYLLRDKEWFLWKPGVAIKDVGLNEPVVNRRVHG